MYKNMLGRYYKMIEYITKSGFVARAGKFKLKTNNGRQIEEFVLVSSHTTLNNDSVGEYLEGK